MVPIYAIDSFVSLRFKEAALYVDMLRDCYEGYALYLFLALMVGYLGDGDEYKVRGRFLNGRVFRLNSFVLCVNSYSDRFYVWAFRRACELHNMWILVFSEHNEHCW